MAWIAAIAVLCALAAPPWTRAQEASEDAVKAAFVYNFVKLVTWPEASFAAPEAPVRICTLAGDPAHEALALALAGRQVGPRPLLVETVDADNAKRCHVVYLGRTLERRYGDAMAHLAAPGILLIDEGGSFTWPHGMIRLFAEEGRIRFELNLAAVEEAGLRVDARMIRLARIATH